MLIPFTQSCLNDYDDDIYDIQAEMPFNAALATVVTPSEVPGEAVIESDNDGIAYVVNPDKLTRFETNNPGQRIFYTYINAANPTGDASKKGPWRRSSARRSCSAAATARSCARISCNSEALSLRR